MKISITDETISYSIDLFKLRNISNALYVKLANELGYEADEDSIYLYKKDIKQLNIPEQVIDYTNYCFNTSNAKFILESYINSNFLNFILYIDKHESEAYKIISNISDLITYLELDDASKDVDVSILETFENGITCIRTSDSKEITYYIMGLSNEQIKQLKDSTPENVKQFIDDHRGK